MVTNLSFTKRVKAFIYSYICIFLYDFINFVYFLEHVKKYASEEAFRGTDVRSYMHAEEESSSESELSDLSEEDEAQDMEL